MSISRSWFKKQLDISYEYTTLVSTTWFTQLYAFILLEKKKEKGLVSLILRGEQSFFPVWKKKDLPPFFGEELIFEEKKSTRDELELG